MLNESPKRTVQFGAFEVKLDTGELRKSGIRINLQGKPFQILQALLARPGEVVTREELQNRLWPGDSMVDFESGLNTAANRLRLALGDSAENPRFVETVARIGYRFVATVIELPAHQQEPALPAPDAPSPTLPAPEALESHSAKWRILIGAAVLVTAIVLLALWSARQPVQPSFQQVTFRSGSIANARFGPDGETILYTANWDAAGNRLYLANTVSPESRALDFKYARLASVSPSSELALIAPDYSPEQKGLMLSRVPLNGGSPLEVASGIASADWDQDGKNLAIFRIGRRESVIEYPIGKVLYRTAGGISHLRVSPKGGQIAFLEHPLRGDDGGLVRLIDVRGTARDLSTGWASVGGLAWSPSGHEIWFTAGQTGVRRAIYAVSLNGAVRRIASVPGTLTLFDISKKGRVLLGIDRSRLMMAGSFADKSGEAKSVDRDISWFDWSHAADMSADGKLLLFDETGDGGGPNHSVYVRNLQTDSTVRLGDGQAVALSPDLKWALALNSKKPTYLSLLPIGPEAPRTVSGNGLKYNDARFFPDGQRLLVAGSFPGKQLRLYVQALNGGDPVPLNPDIFLSWAIVSPDGKQIVGVGPNRKCTILPAAGGESRELAIPFASSPLRWSEDGQALFVRQSDTGPFIRIFRYDLATSQYRLLKELSPRDRVGLSAMFDVVMGNSGQSYAYSYMRVLSELFVVDGWS